MNSKLCDIFVLFLVFRCTRSVELKKNNVAFVIDDTGSMAPVINQVKEKAGEMFKVIYESKTSSVENFILVTFNDYNIYRNRNFYDDFSLKPIKVRVTTRDPKLFFTKLSEIHVSGGGDCPELCLAGIESAIKECNPNSVVYVFTDASAKDYQLEETVKNLAQQKSIQINFLLVVDMKCEVNENVYKKLAAATSGQVFQLKQHNIKEVLDYIIHCLRSPQTPLLMAPISPGSNNLNFTADKDMKNLSIIVNVHPDSSVDLKVTGPKGEKTPTTNLINIPNTLGVVIPDPKNGSYVAKVDTDGTGEATIKAAVTVDFTYGFSSLPPTSMKNTKTRPVPGQETHLAIQLILTGTIDAELQNIQILDLDDNVLTSMPANVINEKEKFYVTLPFKPPDHIFNIQIVVVDKNNKDSPMKRKSRTPVQLQPLPTGTLNYKTPDVNIENKPKIIVEHGKSITLVCKVKAYPEPNIVWEDKENGLEIPSKVSILELPDEFISQLEIKNVKKNGSYKCKATSNHEVMTDSIEVETFRPRFFMILESPKDTEIDYEKDGKVNCKIDAWPLGHVAWYKNDKELTINDNFDISDDKTTLLIKKMRPELEGSYYCRATNDDNSMILDFSIGLSGVESPEFDKTNPISTVNIGSKALVSCRTIKGIPPPMITWKFKQHDSSEFINLVNTGEEIKLTPVEMDNAGIYKCHAKNILGEDYFEITLVVQYPPVIDKSQRTKTATKGTRSDISCRVLSGLPQPFITWEFRRRSATEFISLPETKAEIHIDPVNQDSFGVYKCYAKNSVGEDSHEIEFIVQTVPTVIVNQPATRKIGERVTLTCEVAGEPKPDVTWIRDGAIIKTNEKYKIFSDNSLRFSASLDDRGNFTCNAKNSLGSDSKNATLNIYGQVKIEPPKQSTMIVGVGGNVVLTCRASGIPEPKISWEFFSMDSNIAVKKLSSTQQLLRIYGIQAYRAGYYRCVADNGYENKTITYTVLVNVPVEIEHPEQTKFDIHETDIVLRIPCKAKGYPKPKVSWTKDHTVLSMGNVYAVDSDDTLIIKNPDKLVAGQYICIADNDISTAFEIFTVNLTPIKIPSTPSETIVIEEGTSNEIECKIPHKSVDSIRWFKNGEEIQLSTNQFILRHATVDDSGVYSCRVSSFQGSDTAHFTIKVGSKPYFVNTKQNESIIPFIYERLVHLDCYVNGVPPPTITWWFNGIKLKELSPLYKINKIIDKDKGKYVCEATNDFGTISRTYIIKVTGCRINYVESEKNKFHPVLISSTGNLAMFENQNGVMIIPEGENVEVLCPNSLRHAYCNSNKYTIIDKTLSLEERRVDYTDLKCDSEVEPTIRQYALYRTPCSSDLESRLAQVGYIYDKSFYGVYDVCINQRTQKQFFIKYDMTRYASNIKIGSHPFGNQYIYYNYDDMFNCQKQKHIAGDGCCFLGRQLVSPEDVAPGVQKATYYNINVLPYWNFCGNKLNLNEIERRIRDLAKSIPYKVEVFGGELYSQNLVLNDRNGNRKIVPKYLWKVVQIPQIGQALAIITINVPNLPATEVSRLVFCEDICDKTDWMRNAEWRNIFNGYTFCCKSWDLAGIISPHLEHIFGRNIILTKNIKND